MLGPAKLIRIVTGIGCCPCPVRPCQAPLGWLIKRAIPWGESRENSAFALNHDVARISGGFRHKGNAAMSAIDQEPDKLSPVRDLPQPRPAKAIQIFQSPGGGC